MRRENQREPEHGRQRENWRGKQCRNRCRTWYKQVWCIGAGVFLYIIAAAGQSGSRAEEGYLVRNGYGDDPIVYDLTVEGLSEKPLDCQFEIQPRQYGEEEAERVFEQIIKSLPEKIKGENPSILEVRTDLSLPKEFEDQGIRVSWKSEDPEVLDSYGQIRIQDCPEEGVKVLLTARLTDGVHEKETPLAVWVYPKEMSAEQRQAELLKAWVQEEDRKTLTAGEVELPKEWDGHVLRYRERQEQEYKLFPLFGAVAAVCLYAREKSKEEEERKKRSQNLLLDYADVVYQLMVFTGAGLTVGRAWERIVAHYEKRRNDGRCKERPAYEEMAEAYGQMQCGVPEGKAIIEFGNRCQLQPYLKLSTLLEQNRRTGTKNLQQVLEREMALAWEQQTNTARRMGEEAGTKLLLPLFLMLLVVMVVIMVPAMMCMA